LNTFENANFAQSFVMIPEYEILLTSWKYAYSAFHGVCGLCIQ
jgi:hypothetical protein